MKNRIVTAIILTSALTLVSSVYSQDSKPQNTPAIPPNMMTVMSPETIISNRVNMLSRSLKLTDEQKQKVKPIIEDEYKKYQELRTQKNLSPQDRVAKMREIREATNQKLKPIFTEEQWAKFYRPMTNAPAALPKPATPAQPVPKANK